MLNFESLEDRLDNWGRVVRMPKFQSGVCSQWARWYVACRNSLAASQEPVGAVILKDELDGWIVEAAWASMPNHVAKWMLKYSFVWRMSDDQIQSRMRVKHNANLRGRNMELAMAEARRAISKILAEREAGEIIRNASKKGCKPTAPVL
jgi:hypothetical protein